MATPTTTPAKAPAKAQAQAQAPAKAQAVHYTVLKPINAGKGRIEAGNKLTEAELAERGVDSANLAQLIALGAMVLAPSKAPTVE
jgi:hypothetical protein